MREGLHTVADLVERIEVGGVAVEDVTLSRTDGEELDVDLSVRLLAGRAGADGTTADPEQRDATPDASTADADGALEQSSPPFPDIGERAVELGPVLGAAGGTVDRSSTTKGDGEEPENAATGSSDDEQFRCRVTGCEETFDSEHGMKIHATKAHQSADGSGPSPHRDPDRLREVYERHETFDEMTAALGVDVTAQTVRRSMMSLGIHDPGAGSRDGGEVVDGASTADDAGEAHEGGDADERGDQGPTGTEEPADVTETGATVEDRTDTGEPVEEPARTVDEPAVESVLPEAVDADVLVTAVRDASTLYQVQRALGMEREEVQHLLAELGLLELVHGRVATEAERDLDREAIERRIVDAASEDPDPDDGRGELAEAD
jgi:hypothetical protein